MQGSDQERIAAYLRQARPPLTGWQPAAPFAVLPLARGEYNLNYIIAQGALRWVFRINMGTQINREDQIQYEYQALKLLEPSGVTPHTYFVDDSRTFFDRGVLIMEYLAGESLDYRRDLEAAARVLARIHALPVDPSANHLIVEDKPLSMTFDESAHLLEAYFQAGNVDENICSYLRDVLAWAAEARAREVYFVHDPWLCIINTEVNSGNFIANPDRHSLHLVDWEKPLWGDPSQDLSHFCAPTTTLWKTDYRMTGRDRQTFLQAYCAAMPDAHLRDTLQERVRLRDPFNCLRGISWSAMAWVKYQSGEHALRNEDTFRTISRYLDYRFLRGLFDPFLKSQPAL